ncbi:MAG: hypothetical protein AB7Q16_17985 [Vicinamibacterales bacterium]
MTLRFLRPLALVALLTALPVAPAWAAFGDTTQTSPLGTSTSGDCSATLSAGATSGNLLVFTCARASPPTDWGTAPSGFTLGPNGIGAVGFAVWWKVATGGETTVTAAAPTTSGNWTALVVELEGPFHASPLDVVAESEANLSTTVTSQASGTTDLTTQDAALTLAFFAIDAGSNFGTRQYSNSFTEVASGTSGARAAHAVARRVTTAVGTYSTTLSYSAGGTADEMYGAIMVWRTTITGSAPTVSLSTTNGQAFTTATPTLAFTGTDANGDNIRYRVQVADNTSFATGTVILDQWQATDGTPFTIHPGPLSGQTTWNGQQQVDDRPLQSFDAGGGGMLYSATLYATNDQAGTISGDTFARIYTHSGTYGTSSAPANAAAAADTPTPDWLAESAHRTWDDSEPVAQNPYEHLFSGVNSIQLTPSTKYVLGFDWDATTDSSTNTIGIVATQSGSHGGNGYIDGNSANYGVQATYDIRFIVQSFQTHQQSISGTDSGFSNTVTGGDTDPFNSGELMNWVVQTSLANRTWYWRVRAWDDGSGSYGDWSETRNFTVNATAGGAAPRGTLLGVGDPQP